RPGTERIAALVPAGGKLAAAPGKLWIRHRLPVGSRRIRKVANDRTEILHVQPLDQSVSGGPGQIGIRRERWRKGPVRAPCHIDDRAVRKFAATVTNCQAFREQNCLVDTITEAAGTV